MTNKLFKPNEINEKTNLSLDKVSELAKQYIKTLNHRSKERYILREDSVMYAHDCPILHSPVWYIDIELKLRKDCVIPYGTIVISDVSGKIYNGYFKQNEIENKTCFTAEEIISSTEQFLKVYENNTKEHFKLCTDKILYNLCFKGDDSILEPVWYIDITSERLQKFSDPYHTLIISDITGKVLYLMNDHGRLFDVKNLV